MKQETLDREVARLKGIAQRAIKERKGRKERYSPTQQLNRWMQGAEVQRLMDGEITPEQYLEYDEKMREMYESRIDGGRAG